MKTSSGFPCLNISGIAAVYLFLYSPILIAQDIIPPEPDAVIQTVAVELDEIKVVMVKAGSTVSEVRAVQQVMQDPAIPLDSEVVPSESMITPGSSAIAAAIADGLTTNLALSVGAVESNPLIVTSPIGLVALTGVKIGLVKYAETLPESDKRFALKSTAALWGGAAVNNLMIYLAATPPFPIVAGLIMGVAMWKNMGSQYEKEDQLLAARNKKLLDEQAKLVLLPAQISGSISNE